MKKIILSFIMVMVFSMVNAEVISLKSEMTGLALSFPTGRAIDIPTVLAKFPDLTIEAIDTTSTVKWVKLTYVEGSIRAYIQSDGLIMLYYYSSTLKPIEGETYDWYDKPFSHTQLHYHAREIYNKLFSGYPTNIEADSVCIYAGYENKKILVLSSTGFRIKTILPPDFGTIKKVFFINQWHGNNTYLDNVIVTIKDSKNQTNSFSKVTQYFSVRTSSSWSYQNIQSANLDQMIPMIKPDYNIIDVYYTSYSTSFPSIDGGKLYIIYE